MIYNYPFLICLHLYIATLYIIDSIQYHILNCRKQISMLQLCFSWFRHVWNIMRAGICLPWFNYYNPDNSVNQFFSLWLLAGWKMRSLWGLIISGCEVEKMMKMSCWFWQRIDLSVSLSELQQAQQFPWGKSLNSSGAKVCVCLHQSTLKSTHMQFAVI